MAALSALFLGASTVAAKEVRPYAYSTSFDGSGSNAGPFGEVGAIEVNQVTDNVIVIDKAHGGVIDQFNAVGAPVPFSDPALGGATSIVVGPYEGGGFDNSGPNVAIDNTGLASQGNLYVHLGNRANTLGFDQTGRPLGLGWPICAGPCGNNSYYEDASGVDVAPDGTLWIGSRASVACNDDICNPSFLSPFDLEGRSLENGSRRLHLRRPLPSPSVYGVGFSAAGDVYVSSLPWAGQQPQVIKYDGAGIVVDQFFAKGSSHETEGNFGPELTVDRATGNVLVSSGKEAPPVIGGDFTSGVEVYDSAGSQIDSFGEGSGAYEGVINANGIAINEQTKAVYLANNRSASVDVFVPGAPVRVPDVGTAKPAPTPTTAQLRGSVDPDNGGDTTECYFEWGPVSEMENVVPCAEGSAFPSAGGAQPVSALVGGLVKGRRYLVRLVSDNANDVPQAGQIEDFRASAPPLLSGVTLREVTAKGAVVNTRIDPEGGDTTYYVEYGPTDEYGSRTPLRSLAAPLSAEDVTAPLAGLSPATTYHYRIVVENDAGTVASPDRTLRTYPFEEVLDDPCPNALARQQSGAALLLDCRSYELASAVSTASYNVESDLVPGQTPQPGYPHAADKLLYAVHDGGIPGTGEPTNNGPDPYVAIRGPQGWTTEYVGIPANGTPSTTPFSSTLASADSNLTTFAFAGPNLCAPCFPDGSTNIPLRLPDGSLIPGMTGPDPEPADPAGYVGKHLSADGSHFVFGTTAQLDPDAVAGSVTIYDRDLDTGQVRVVSRFPDGEPMTGQDVAQLDVSEDGSRIVVAERLGTDPAGNALWHPYMHVGGSPQTIDLAPGTTSGVRYDGMTADGSRVFLSAVDQLTSDDTDAGVDLFRADVGGGTAVLTRVSAGSDPVGNTDSCDPLADAVHARWNSAGAAASCDAVAFAGGGGVAAADGGVYFLSPELLAGPGQGIEDAPNLYLAEPGAALRFVATLESSLDGPVSNPAVVHAVDAALERFTADIQVSPDGRYAVFTTVRSLTGYENNGFSEVFRYDAGTDQLACVSCAPSNTPATGAATLASAGLSLTEDGRVFFTSADSLALRDSNRRLDAYEWSPAEGGVVELISSGSSPEDSSFFSVSADGRDAFFFTREKLIGADQNGSLVRIYDAREEGGFFELPPRPPCVAADECRGAGTAQPRRAAIGTLSGTPGQHAEKRRKRCRKGFRRRKGKCVRKRKSKRARNHRRGHRGNRHGGRR